MQENTTFKEIPLEIVPINPKARTAVKNFNAIFRADEVQIVIKGNTATIHLREVDIDKMKATIADIIKICALPPQNNILATTQEKICRIKSFGMRGRVRNFTDYNKEVKVKNRTGKEQQRNKLGYARADFSREINPVPPAYDNKIICGDSRKNLKKASGQLH